MVYRFGLFEFDASTNELTTEGRRVPLEPQPARALALLLSRAGDVVTRDDLRACLWGAQTHVDFDRGLGYCIGELRSALRDRADNPRFVQTLPRRGYRFIAPVIAMATAGPPGQSGNGPNAAEAANSSTVAVPRAARARWIAAALIAATVVATGVWAYARRVQMPSRPIIAVAIFDNETGDAGYDRFVHGLADVVVDRLTALGPDRVGIVGNMPELRRGRAERDLGAIARATGASFITFGQLQVKGEGLSLLIHLIRVADGTHIWVQRIARPSGDTLAGVDEEAARLIADAVRARVLR